jgi:hypothetical protein
MDIRHQQTHLALIALGAIAALKIQQIIRFAFRAAFGLGWLAYWTGGGHLF